MLIETGYETDRDWGLAELPRNYMPGPVARLKAKHLDDAARGCWCDPNAQMSHYSEDYQRCEACGSLVGRYVVSQKELTVRDDAADLYGQRYWQEPVYYRLQGNLTENARYGLTRWNMDVLRVVLSYVPSSAQVLDLGCGSGALAALVKQAGYDVRGVEMSPGVVDSCARIVRDCGGCWSVGSLRLQ